jgi:hypothetical protein
MSINVQSYDQISEISVQAISSAWAPCGSLAFHASSGTDNEDDMDNKDRGYLDVRQWTLRLEV